MLSSRLMKRDRMSAKLNISMDCRIKSGNDERLEQGQKLRHRQTGLRDDRSKCPALEITAVHGHRHFSRGLGPVDEPAMTAGRACD